MPSNNQRNNELEFTPTFGTLHQMPSNNLGNNELRLSPKMGILHDDTKGKSIRNLGE